MIGGGYMFDGRQIAPIDETALDEAIADIIHMVSNLLRSLRRFRPPTIPMNSR